MVLDPDHLLTERLRDGGHRVTAQRLIAYRLLWQLRRHVSAEELLTAVAERLPTVALPTIYDTLDLLEKLGLVRRVATVGGAAIYDPVLEPHHHVLCSGCGAMQDLPIDFDLSHATMAARSVGFQAQSMDVVVHGLCQTCRIRAPRS
jgi:Fe2+ or Zn2+ uptake regulation protein